MLVVPSAATSLATSTPPPGTPDSQNRHAESAPREREAERSVDPARRAEMLGESLALRTPRALPSPPFDAFTRPGLVPTPGKAPQLVQLSVRRNGASDLDAWLRGNGLVRHGFVGARRVEGGELPSGLPAQVEGRLVLWGQTQPLRTTLVLGRDWSGGQRVAVLDAANHPVDVFDFTAWARAPFTEPGAEAFVEQTVFWAEAHDDVLYVATGHSTYAKSSGGKNAFVSAIDLRSGELLWQSAPLVSNAGNFIVVGAWIVCGYGFTAEPDALFVLDRATGKTVARAPLSTGPTNLVLKDGTLYVRTYDHDLTFRLQVPGEVPLGMRR